MACRVNIDGPARGFQRALITIRVQENTSSVTSWLNMSPWYRDGPQVRRAHVRPLTLALALLLSLSPAASAQTTEAVQAIDCRAARRELCAGGRAQPRSAAAGAERSAALDPQRPGAGGPGQARRGAPIVSARAEDRSELPRCARRAPARLTTRLAAGAPCRCSTGSCACARRPDCARDARRAGIPRRQLQRRGHAFRESRRADRNADRGAARPRHLPRAAAADGRGDSASFNARSRSNRRILASASCWRPSS